MAQSAERGRRFVGYARGNSIPSPLLDSSPKLGKRFAQDVPDAPKAREDWTIKARLVGDLGPRGYGRLLQRLEELAAGTKPKRSRRRPRKARGGARPIPA